MSIATKTIPAYTGELYTIAFDFQDFPEIEAGETISSPAIAAVSGVTIGTPAVNTVDFYPGRGARMIPAGKGVIVTVYTLTAGTYTLNCTASFSGGATGRRIRGTWVVEA